MPAGVRRILLPAFPSKARALSSGRSDRITFSTGCFCSPGSLGLSPWLIDRAYTVKTSTTLGVPMTPLTGSTFIDNGNERTVTDTAATGSAKFYSVEIVKP